MKLEDFVWTREPAEYVIEEKGETCEIIEFNPILIEQKGNDFILKINTS